MASAFCVTRHGVLRARRLRVAPCPRRQAYSVAPMLSLTGGLRAQIGPPSHGLLTARLGRFEIPSHYAFCTAVRHDGIEHLVAVDARRHLPRCVFPRPPLAVAAEFARSKPPNIAPRPKCHAQSLAWHDLPFRIARGHRPMVSKISNRQSQRSESQSPSWPPGAWLESPLSTLPTGRFHRGRARSLRSRADRKCGI